MDETEADPGSSGGAAAFAELVRGPDAEVDLGRAALSLGRIARPDLDLEPLVAQLDALGDQSREGLPDQARAAQAAERVRQVLFVEAGFQGDRRDYYNPLNAYLHALLERRVGMPILLAILFIEVGRRVGLEVQGVGAPGHFYVKYADDGGERFLDPFDGGREMAVEDLRKQIAAAAGQQSMSTEALLQSVTKRQILTRVLTNLKGCYARREELAGALGAVEYMLAMTPWALEEIRDRGFLLFALERYDESLQSLIEYRSHAPNGGDLMRVERLIQRIEGISRSGGSEGGTFG